MMRSPICRLTQRLTDDQALALAEYRDLGRLMQVAAARRDAGPRQRRLLLAQGLRPAHAALCGTSVTTARLRRRPLARIKPPYLSLDDVLEIARAGQAAQCKEVLFTLGDKPELRYPVGAHGARSPRSRDDDCRIWQRRRTRCSTETGLLPHVNPGCHDGIGSRRAAPRVDLARHHARKRIGSTV